MVVAMNKDAISIIQQQAEAILDRLGIPVSVFIDMTYRQVIMRDGVPFSLDIPDKLVTRDSITQGLDEATGEKEYTMLWKRK